MGLGLDFEDWIEVDVFCFLSSFADFVGNFLGLEAFVHRHLLRVLLDRWWLDFKGLIP